MKVDRSKWPSLVRLGLWGIPTRKFAWVFVFLSVVLAVSFVAFGFLEPRLKIGGLFVFAALAYYLSIRWVDQNSSWDD